MSFKELIEQWSSRCDFVSIRKVSQKSYGLDLKNGNLEYCGDNETLGVMINVINDGCYGYAAVPSLEVDILNDTFENALKIANSIGDHNLIDSNQFLKNAGTSGTYKTKNVKKWEADSFEYCLEKLNVIAEALKAKHVINSVCSYQYLDVHTQIYTSKGVEIDQTLIISNVSFSLTAFEKGKEAQERSYSNGLQYGLEVFDLFPFEQMAKDLTKEANQLLNAEDCPKGTYDIVL